MTRDEVASLLVEYGKAAQDGDGETVQTLGETLLDGLFGPDTDDPMPVFVLKGRDCLAVEAIHSYRRACRREGLMRQAGEVQKAIAEMCSWQTRHPRELKLPDHDHVPVGGGHADRG